MRCACDPESRARFDEERGSRDATELLHELWWEHSAEVSWIGVDMWMGVEVTVRLAQDDPDDVDDGTPPLISKFYMECDRFEDALVGLIQHFNEAKKEATDGSS